MLRELDFENFDDDMVWFCGDHGEYTEFELERAGIESGCPFCFAVEQEDISMEIEGC